MFNKNKNNNVSYDDVANMREPIVARIDKLDTALKTQAKQSCKTSLKALAPYVKEMGRKVPKPLIWHRRHSFKSMKNAWIETERLRRKL